MRAVLGEADGPLSGLLDTWAVVADTVSFYTERLATEGFLQTATELSSVRELARMVGYEVRPGVAATADLAFTVDVTASAEVHVPAGTPVQTVPGQDQLPQTFETSDDLVAHESWNSISAVAVRTQEFRFGDREMWLNGTGLGVREGDCLLVVGRERLRHGQNPGSGGHDRWEFRIVQAVTENPPGRDGWTRVDVRGDSDRDGPVAEEEATVFTFSQRASLFGWNALEPTLFATEIASRVGITAEMHWSGFDLADAVEAGIDLDGDYSRLRGGAAASVVDASWVVLQSPERTELYRATRVTPGGISRFGLAGRVTNVRLDVSTNLAGFQRRSTVVHCQSRVLPAAQAPLHDSVTGRVLVLERTTPPLTVGRRVLVTGAGVAVPAVVRDCVASGTSMTVTLDRQLPAGLDPSTLRVLGNVVEATHGETVNEVLGSGDGRTPFMLLRTKRGPLTHVRAASPSGARSTLEVRVDGAAWTEVNTLEQAGTDDRAFVTREENGTAIQFGDGVHGARPPTGVENIRATYRVGIGEDGAAAVDQLTMLTRRPLGIASVRNPAPARDWAAPETLASARRNAPLRIRTLDRAVSRSDHENFAAAFAGVMSARADEVWDGRTETVVVSILGTGGAPVSDGLVGDLATALEAARDPSTRLRIMHGERRWFGVRLALTCDPAYSATDVVATVRARLTTRLAHAARRFAQSVTAAEVLVVVRAVPGVVACTVPVLLDLPGWMPGDSRPNPNATGVAVIGTLPARAEGGELRPAQLSGLATDVVRIEVMSR
ncbi:hypothetical protein [Mycolicibacterium celeriflavum]|uniref:hypothetical protein n=1 Tax=Mycolicibacterium celeriflavum TaxID=1249101 RepID=UPI003CF3B6CF